MAVRNEKNCARIERRQLEAPQNSMDVILILAEAIRLLCCTERRYIFYLPRAIAHAVLDKDKKTVGNECCERSDCVQVKGPEILKDLYELKKLLTRAMLFSNSKRFLAFLFATGFQQEDVLLRKRAARILKPAFTVIRDKESECLLVFIRGTRSIKDTLTDALCAPVSFDHFHFHERHNMVSGVVVSGYAHRGMVAAASWIKKHCIPVLLEALHQYPHFKIKIVGHSLGGGTAALLTYKLREMEQFSSTTCVTFGPAACMTLELAEFGKPFITSIINGSDIVPTLSASSVHDFIDEGRIKDKNILEAVGSRLAFAKTVAEHALNCFPEVVKKHKHSLLPWSQAENIDTLSDNLAEASGLSETSFEPLLSEEHLLIESIDEDEYNSSNEGSDDDDSDDDENQLLNQVGKFKVGKHVNISNIHAKYITEEDSDCPVTTSGRQRLYPPGRIMHMISSHSSENSNSKQHEVDEKHVCLYETPTQLYGKLRFSRGMILDHPTKKYMKKLQQLINQLEEEQFKYRGG